jgi:anti-sigma regulatory factor (Ser/Thr protein kinase)
VKEARAFPHAVSSVPQARRYVTSLLGDAPGEVLDAVALMVSELATNACRHAETDFVVAVEHDARHIRVEVTDGGAGDPVARAPERHELSGRGLRIVEQLSDAWGVIPAEGAGKTVWFSISAGPTPVAAS